MIRKVLFMFFLLTVVSYSSLAETVKWLVRPEYDAISYFNEKLFKCKKEGKYRLIDMEGNSVVADFDSITGFHEGIALVLDKRDCGYGIRGFFFEKSNRFDPIEGNYFAGPYSFFSEGLVSVIDVYSRKTGYLDSAGRIKIPCRYRQGRPFSHGWAAVEPTRKRKRTLYINSEQERLKIKDFHRGIVIMGSSFNSEGNALVSYYDDDNAIIGTAREKDGKIVGVIKSRYKRNDDNSPVRACDFAFDTNGKPCITGSNKQPTFDSSITAFSLGKRFGYMKEERVIVPAQFAYAGGFANRCAIVSIDGSKYGILLLADGEFGGNLNGENVIVKKDKKEKYKELTYSFIIPKSMEGIKYQIEFDKGDGAFRPIVLQNNDYTFIPSVDENREYCLMRTRVIAEDLVFWADSIERGIGNIFIKEINCSDKANEKDEFRVTATVHNGSNVDTDVKVTFFFGSRDEMNLEKNIEEKKTQEDKIKIMKAMKDKGGITKFGIPKRSKTISSKSDEVFTSMIKVEHVDTIPLTISVKIGDEIISRKTDTIVMKPFY